MEEDSIQDLEHEDPYFNGHEDEMTRMRHSKRILRKVCKNREVYPSLAAAFSAVCVGSVVSWTSGAAYGFIKEHPSIPYKLSRLQLCLAVSLLPMGATIGALFSGTFTQFLGRKLALQCMTLPCVVSWVMLLLGKSVWWLYTARTIAGMAMGTLYTIAIVYIAEICRPSIRGLCCVFVQIGYTLGVLYSNILNALSKNNFFPITVACLPLPFIAAILMQLAPETPQHLIHRHQLVKAVKNLQQLRGAEEDIEDEFEEMMNAEEDENDQDMFKQKSMRKAFYITAGLMAFQQLTGINNIIMNLEEISIYAMVFVSSSISPVVIAIVMLVTVCIAAGVVDRVGRKLLLMISIGTMGVMALVMLICLVALRFMSFHPMQWIIFLSLLMYACIYNLGIGPLPWVIMAEVMPQKFRGSTCGLASAIGWFICTLASASYCLIPSLIANYALYTFFCFLGLAFIKCILPETKGYTLEEIHGILEQ